MNLLVLHDDALNVLCCVYKLLNYTHIIIFIYVENCIYFQLGGHVGTPSVPAGMPLNSQGTSGFGLHFPVESIVQKSGHVGTSGGHETSLDF